MMMMMMISVLRRCVISQLISDRSLSLLSIDVQNT